MNPELIRQREAFKKRALSQPTVEKRKLKKDDREERSAKKQKPSASKAVTNSSNANSFDYKTSQGSSQYKFSILAKIVKFMKQRHQQGDTYPLTIDEILDETSQLDIGNKNKHWLATEALLNNPKVLVVVEDGENKFKFNPRYSVKDRKGLINLLKRHDLHGEGGVLLDDIEESLPNCSKSLRMLGDNIVYVTRPNDKKKILFYNDKYCQFLVDEEFQKMWRGVSVEGDDKKIEEYLNRQGITSMQDTGLKKPMLHQKRRKGTGRQKFKSHNEHLSGVLEDYSELTNKKS